MANIVSRKVDELLEISKIFGEKILNIKDEITKPTSFYKGEAFEEYVEDNLFPESDYILVRRTDTYERNVKRFSESTYDPDFIFRCRKTRLEFAVEAKYRSKLTKRGELLWTNEKQRKRYIDFDLKHYPVFIVVGFKGVSNKPQEIYLFPVCHTQGISVNLETAVKYNLEPGTEAISIEHLRKLIKS